MSITPVHIRPTTHAAASGAAAPPPPTAATPAAPSTVQQDAAADVHSLQAARPAAQTTDAAYRAAIDAAVRIYLEDGPAALREHLGAQPAALSSLANVGAVRLEGDLERALEHQATGLRHLSTGLDAATMQGMVEEVAGARVRQGIVQEAETVVAARLAGLQQLSDGLPGRLESLRNARPGTPEHVEAQLLGIRGDAADLERARAAIAHSADGLRTFVNRMRGQSWQPGEFPDAASRAARRLNLQGAADSSGVTAGARTEAPGAHVHSALQLAEAAHVVGELGHLAHGVANVAVGTAAAAGLAVSVVGLLVGSVIHHYTEEAHQAHITFGRSLGL
ncbi:MAG: hypothetical protein H6726_02750 [Sandaracinaceae bacterium]|nr:hypothetical protein [Myxococcales bacterium]MCB9656543.1 hypothetical protein [Sandaracinaceae bacterium]